MATNVIWKVGHKCGQDLSKLTHSGHAAGTIVFATA